MLNQNIAVTDTKNQIIEDILKDMPSNAAIEVSLPSENKLYSLPDPGSPITMRPMTFEDEKNLISAKKGQDPINIILTRCVDNVSIGELLPMDKLYLIMKLREISYGDDYKSLLLCKHCSAENPTTIYLSKLNVNPVPDDFSDPIEVLLPAINKVAKIRLPRVRDEAVLADTEKALDQIWRFVAEIDGHKDKSIIAPVIAKLPIVDMRTIMKAMKTDYGVDTNVKFQCKECKEVQVIDLPIDAGFFDVS